MEMNSGKWVLVLAAVFLFVALGMRFIAGLRRFRTAQHCLFYLAILSGFLAITSIVLVLWASRPKPGQSEWKNLSLYLYLALVTLALTISLHHQRRLFCGAG